jgi:TIR domain
MAMASTIQLRQGSIFSGPTDLIIIPCSTAATITSVVEKELRNFDIRRPRGYMNLGDIKFELFEGASSISTYVGYAASVEGMRTTSKAITIIAKSIADFVKEKSEIRDIAVPLLGSGAGGLTPKQSARALALGFEGGSTDGKVFNIFVYKQDDFEELSKDFAKSRAQLSTKAAVGRKSREAVRVFISYTKTTTQHHEWVRDLAKFLRENGVDARLDVWHLRPGMDLPQWRCNEIDQADRILIICNEEYASKANGRQGGVGWEIRLIQGDLMQSQSTNPKKYIPIMRENIEAKNMPSFLRGTYALSWSDGGDDRPIRDRLLREIYEVFEEAPPLGQPPRYIVK